MRRLAIGLLALFRRVSLFVWKLRGKTEDDVAAQRVSVLQAQQEAISSVINLQYLKDVMQ